MKRKVLSIILLLAIFISFFMPASVQAANKIKLNKAKVVLEVDAKITLKLGDIAATDVKWSSSAKKVATVTSKGTVTAKAEGSATITATYNKKKYTCNINVVDNNKIEEDKESSGKVEILAEYTLPDGIGWYTRHFIVVKNNTKETVGISTSSLAYAKDGSVIGAASGEFEALGAGCTSIFYEAFETEEEIDYYKTELNYSKSKYYKSIIQDLSYARDDIKNGLVLQVKNNGDNAADFVQAWVLFFKDGKLVDYDNGYFTDDDFELKPGKKMSKQFNTNKEFDNVEFYFDGRR